MSIFRKRIKLISTDYGFINESMYKFLKEKNLNRIIHIVGIPEWSPGGYIYYKFSKKI